VKTKLDARGVERLVEPAQDVGGGHVDTGDWLGRDEEPTWSTPRAPGCGCAIISSHQGQSQMG